MYHHSKDKMNTPSRILTEAHSSQHLFIYELLYTNLFFYILYRTNITFFTGIILQKELTRL